MRAGVQHLFPSALHSIANLQNYLVVSVQLVTVLNSMSFTNCPGDASFGPTVRGCRGNFDFTLTFEQIFFSIIPASLFILASCTRIQRLLKRPRIAGGRISWVVKLVGS